MVPAVMGSFFAIIFSILALVHLRFPSDVKRLFDSLGKAFGTSKFMADFGEDYYRMVGGVYAVCAVAMAFGTLVAIADLL